MQFPSQTRPQGSKNLQGPINRFSWLKAVSLRTPAVRPLLSEPNLPIEHFLLGNVTLHHSTLPQLKGSLSWLQNPKELSILFLSKHSSPEITCRMKGGLMSAQLGLFPAGIHIFHLLLLALPLQH